MTLELYIEELREAAGDPTNSCTAEELLDLVRNTRLERSYLSGQIVVEELNQKLGKITLTELRRRLRASGALSKSAVTRRE